LTAVLLLGLSLGGARYASAQATTTVRANVFLALSFSNMQNLRFQTVFPGVPKTVSAAAPQGGQWRVNGQPNAMVAMTFTLPTDMVRNVTGELMPIGAWTGLHNTVNNPATGVAFTPSSTATSAQLSTQGRRWVYIGATVSPAANQRRGNYTAVATLTVAYL
jgi:hypothetical protein